MLSLIKNLVKSLYQYTLLTTGIPSRELFVNKPGVETNCRAIHTQEPNYIQKRSFTFRPQEPNRIGSILQKFHSKVNGNVFGRWWLVLLYV